MDNREEEEEEDVCCCWSDERDDDNVDTKLNDRCRIDDDDDDTNADRDNPRGPAPTTADPEKAAAIMVDPPLRRNPLPRIPIIAILTTPSKRCVLLRNKLEGRVSKT
jgi:hypothetical protein